MAERGGSSRLMIKLKTAMDSKMFYEAHQLLRTINFRYTTSKKYAELEELLFEHSLALIENNQVESGTDVAVMLSKLYMAAQAEVDEARVENVIKLTTKIPPTPERANFVSGMMEWLGNSDLSGRFHATVAEMYISEQFYADSWRHIMRVTDGKVAAALTFLLMSNIGILKEEFDLVVANLVLTFLSAKRVNQAEQAFLVLIKKEVRDLSPLLNGVRFLIESAKSNNPQAFKSIRDIYEPSFSRDPYVRKLVGSAGKSLFSITDRNDRSSNSLMPMLFNAFLQPDQPTLD